MDFFGARMADHLDDLPAGRAPHNGIVHDDDALPFQHLLNRIELNLDPEMPDALFGLDEGPTDIMVSDQPVLVGNVRAFRVAERRRDARVRDRNDDVRRHVRFLRELPAQGLSRGIDGMSVYLTVRSR